MKKRILSMLLALVMLATLLPLGLIDTAEAATGAQILTPTSGTSGTGANGGTWKCSSAGDTLTLTDYDGYPIETDATTIRFSGTNTITVPLSNLSGALRVYGLKLTSTKDIWMRGEDGSSLNIVFKPGSGTEDVDVSGIDADGPLLIDTAGDITISAPYGYPYGIRARQGLDYSGPGALDITVRGSYFWKSNHWCAAYGIAAEKGAISLSGSGSKTIRVQSGANTQQISSTPYAIYHKGGTGSSGTATISVDTGALHIEMNGDGCGIYNMGSADSAYVNINNVPELSIEKADSAIETAYSGTVNVRNSKLRIANGRYAIRNSGGTINMENADVTAAVRGSSVGYTDAAVHTGTLQVKGSSTVDMTATYGTVVYARAVSVNLSNGSFTAKTGQSKWPPIDAPVTLGVKTRLMTGVCSDAYTGKYAGTQVDDLYVTSFSSVESGTCGENVNWRLTGDGTLTISGTGAMYDYTSTWKDGEGETVDTPWFGLREQIRRVVVGEGVTTIGAYAFTYLYSLTSVSLPAGLQKLGRNVFRGCEKLTSVTIPDGVRHVGSDLFAECHSLKTVSLPDSLQSLGGAIFVRCTSLTNVTLPRGLDQVIWHMFYGCTALTTVTLPGSIQEIAEGAFSGCTALSTVHFGGSQADWQAVTVRPDNDALKRAKVDYATTMLPAPNLTGSVNRYGELTLNWTAVKGADSYQIFRAVKNGNSLFYVQYSWVDDSQTSLSIPSQEPGETYVYKVCAVDKDGAAGICSNEYTFTYNPTGPGATSSGSGQCGESAKWTLDASGTLTISGTGAMYDYDYIGERNPAPWCADGLNNRVRTVVVEKGITELGTCSFADLYNLTSVSLPAGLQLLWHSVFSGCEKLTSVTIPNGVRYAGGDLFWGCRSLKTVSLPDSLRGLGGGTFVRCTSLAKVTLPRGLNDVTYHMFNGCTALTTVTLPGSIQEIAEGAFSGCTALSTVHFGGSQAGWQAVTVRPDNDALKRAKVDYATTTMLPAPKLTGSVSRYGELTLNWTAVKGADIYQIFRAEKFQNSWEYVQYSGVDGSQTSFGIPSQEPGETYVYKVRAVDKDGAVGICSNEYTFTYNPTGPGVTSSTSGKCGESAEWTLDASGTLTISGTGAMYDYDYIGERNPAPWCADGLNNRVRTVVVEKGITELGYDVFAACGELRKVTLPSGLKRIGAEAFLGCSNLPELTIPSTVTSIEWNAFTRCDSIKTLTLPDGLKEIGDAACAEMEDLSSVTLGKGITYLSENMFAMCPKLTSVTVPEGVTDIGSCAFRDCENLQTLRLPASLKTVGEAASSGTSIADVYFAGTAAQWNALRMEPGNNHIRCAKVHYRNAAAVPAAPKIKLTTSGNQFQLSWDAVPGAASYQVYRIVDFTVEDYTLLGTTKSTTFTDKTAKTGTTYTFAVKAVNANGESMTSSSCAGKLSARPANVTLVSAKAVSGGIQVTWKEAAGAATYKVYRKDAANPDWTALTTTATGTSYVDKTAEPGVTYTYTVRGVASDGKTLSPSHDKTGVSATMPKPVTRPANVTLVSAKAVSGGIQVTWKEAAGAATYKVYRKDAANPDWTALTTTATGTSYVDKTAVAGVTYTYTVRGVASDGKTLSPSHDKTGVSATMPKPVSRPANVTLVSAKAVSGGIQVTWKEAAGAATYKVYRKDAANPDWTGLTTTATGTSYVDKTAEPGVTYTYTVRGVASDGKTLSPSHDKTGVSATMPKPVSRPANVTLVSAKAVSGGIQVTWKEAAGAATYKVYRKDATNTSWTGLTTTATGTSYVDKTAEPGVTYTYTVRGVASDGKTLSPSHDKTGVSAVIAPAKVTLIRAEADSAGILVTWQKATGAHSYQVYRKTAGTGWKCVAKNIHDTEWKDIDAAKGTKYIYTVRAVADDGTTRGGYDAAGKTATVTKDPTTPANVTLGKAVAGKGSITVTWSYAADARTYRVYRKAAGETKWTIMDKNATGKSWTDTNVTKGTTYTYTVRGVNANGKLSPSHDKTGVSAVAK